MATEYYESVADSPDEIAKSTMLDILAKDHPWVFITVEEADNPVPGTDGLKITARVGGGITTAKLTRAVLQKSLNAIPE